MPHDDDPDQQTTVATPITRAQLDAALAKYEALSRDEQAAMIERALARARSTTSAEIDQKLELWTGALWADIKAHRAETGAGFAAVRAEMREMEGRLLAELARHAQAIQESVATPIGVVDDKYKDLPDRVSRLEQRRTRRRGGAST